MAGDGYVRQSSASIQPGEDITATPLNNEFNEIQDAFNASTGHSHDGSTGNAPPIDLTTSVDGVLSQVNGGTGSDDGTIDFDSATFGEITMDATTGIHRDAADSVMVISGGTTGNLGANVLLYGESHATAADDILFRTDTTEVGRYDASETQWDFTGSMDVSGSLKVASIVLDSSSGILRDIEISNLNLSGGSTLNTGGNIILYGTSHATVAGDLLFRSDTSTVARYDASATEWEFNGDLDWNGAADISGAVDIGGALDVGGNIDVTGSAIVGSSLILSGNLIESVDTSSMTVSGGSGSSSGGNIIFYGGTHATLANDISIRSSGTEILRWDDSDDRFELRKQFTAVDSIPINFGNEDDASIDHNGSRFMIQNDTGVMYLRNNTTSSSVQIEATDSGDTLNTVASFGGSTSAAYLYYDGDLRFFVNDNGAEVTGPTAAYLNLDDETATTTNINSRMRFLQAGAIAGDIGFAGDDDIRIRNNSTAGHIIFDTNGNTGGIIYFRIGGTEVARVDENGILLRDDDNIDFGDSREMSIFHSSNGNSYIDIESGHLYIRNRDNSSTNGVYIQDQDSGGANHNTAFFGHNGVILYYDNSTRFRTTSGGGTLTGDLIVTEDLNVEGSTMFLGGSGEGDSSILFHDDNSNTDRTFQWDDSQNFFRAEDNNGTAWPISMFSTGSSSSSTDFPLGSIVGIRPGSIPAIRGTISPRTTSGNWYVTSGGSALAGTWRSIGQTSNESGAQFVAAQKVAN